MEYQLKYDLKTGVINEEPVKDDIQNNVEVMEMKEEAN